MTDHHDGDLPLGSSLPHLERHHGDFGRFHDAMVASASGRFGPLWWGVWDEHVQVPPDATIVDLGTGPGMMLPMLRQRVPEGRLIGVEVQPRMLETARRVATEVDAELVEADLAHPLPLDDGSADVVTSVMTFHELPHPPTMLAEAFRLLRPGGILVLYDWVKWPLRDYLEGKELTPGVLDHFREHCMFSADDLAFLCEREGFEVRELIGRRGNRYAIVVATRPQVAGE